MKPRGEEGQNGRLKCPLGFLVFSGDGNVTRKFELVYDEDEDNEENTGNEEVDTEVRTLMYCFAGKVYLLQSRHEIFP